MKSIAICVVTLLAAAAALPAQQSPPATAAAVIGGKTITIEYSAPSVRGRKIFGDDGLVMNDPNAPVWRAGANAATILHTDADIAIGGLAVSKGDYSLFVNVKDPDARELIVNRQTGQSGLEYDFTKDLGHVKMVMSKPPALIETLKYSIIDSGKGRGAIRLAWEHHLASVPVVIVTVGDPAGDPILPKK